MKPKAKPKQAKQVQPKEKRPVGRPTSYTPEMAERICVWIAGGKSLRSFCAANEDSPDLSTICRWIVGNTEFRKQYVSAREAAGFAHADGIVDVTEQVEQGLMDDRAARVIMDGLKWAAERMAPKHHSPRQELTGAEGAPVAVTTINPSKLSLAALRELMAAKKAKSDKDR